MQNERDESNQKELRRIQTMVRPLESLTKTQQILRGALEAAIVGLGPPLSLFNRSLGMAIFSNTASF